MLTVAIPLKRGLAYSCIPSGATTTISPPNISVQRDLPVGSVIGTADLSSGAAGPFTCYNFWPNITGMGVGIKSTGTYVATIAGRRVYATNIAGIGYAIGVTGVSVCAGNVYYVNGQGTGDGNPDNMIFCGANEMFTPQPVQMKAVLTYYKTAAITGAGVVNSMRVGGFITLINGTDWVNPPPPVTAGSFTVSTLACSVNSSTVKVNMGTIEKRSFSGVGSTPDGTSTRSFNIDLNCNANTRVNLQVDGNAYDAAKGVLLVNNVSGAATGVGVQMLYNNTPLPLGKVNSIGVVPISGNYNIPLQARYYQTATTIMPGPANSTATFTLTYN